MFLVPGPDSALHAQSHSPYKEVRQASCPHNSLLLFLDNNSQPQAGHYDLSDPVGRSCLPLSSQPCTLGDFMVHFWPVDQKHKFAGKGGE